MSSSSPAGLGGGSCFFMGVLFLFVSLWGFLFLFFSIYTFRCPASLLASPALILFSLPTGLPVFAKDPYNPSVTYTDASLLGLPAAVPSEWGLYLCGSPLGPLRLNILQSTIGAQ